MSAQAIEFLQEWIDENCQAPSQPAKIDKQAEALALLERAAGELEALGRG